MTGFFARRAGQMVPTLLGISVLVFMMVRLLPGDPAAFIAGENAGEAALAALRTKLGLDEPLMKQFVTYLSGLVRGDLGTSLLTGVPVLETLLDALPVTLLVTVISMTIGFAIAVPLGALAAFNASKGRTLLDHLLTNMALVVDTIPPFWLALLFMLFFSLKLGWLPSTGDMPYDSPLLLAKRLALPVMVLGLAQVSSVARVTRTAVMDVLNEDYVRTARATGTGEIQVLFGHALRNAALPIVTVAGLSFGRLLGGTVVLETVFALPGVGTTLVNAIYGRDYPVVQGAIAFYALTFVFVNLLTDLLYTRIDPRVKL